MASVDFHQKISGHEAKEWIRNVCDAMDRGATFDDEESFINFISEHKPKDFKAPRKQRASKKSSEDRAATEYNCQLCDARVWNSGLGGQCSRKKIDGDWCCSIHSKEAAKNDGKLRNGLITEERPTHAYGDDSQALLPWHDVELPKKTKKMLKNILYHLEQSALFIKNTIKHIIQINTTALQTLTIKCKKTLLI